MAIGKRIKLALREEDISIKKLAEEIGVSVNTLYSVTKRDSERIDPITLDRISKALDLPLSFFKSEPPFDDLEKLSKRKEYVLQTLSDAGCLELDGILPADIKDTEYWAILGDHGISNVDSFLLGNIWHEAGNYDKSHIDILSELAAMDKLYSAIPEEMAIAYSKLNTDGQQIAVERVQELTEIKKYRKEQE